MVASCGNPVSGLLRNCQAVFQSDCPIFHSHRHCMRTPVPPHSWPHLVLSIVPIVATLVCVTSHCGSDFTSLMTVSMFSRAYRSFVFLLWRKINQILRPFVIGLFVFLLWVVIIPYMFWFLNLITSMICECYFLPFCGLPFHCLGIF